MRLARSFSAAARVGSGSGEQSAGSVVITTATDWQLAIIDCRQPEHQSAYQGSIITSSAAFGTTSASPLTN